MKMHRIFASSIMKPILGLFFIALLLAGCGSSSGGGLGISGDANSATGNGSGGGGNNSGSPHETLISTGSGDSDLTLTSDNTPYFYFSYDDSASTAAVELVKYQLNNNIVPPEGLARPWEFLNHENFDPSTPVTLGLFQVSMGLMERSYLTDQEKTEYKLGVYVGSPQISKDDRDNVVLTIIVDVSGSMETNILQVEEGAISRLDLVRYALIEMIDSLKEGDIISIVTFSSDAETVLEDYLFIEDSEGSELRSVINDLVTIGSTNLDKGIDEGYSIARNYYDSSKLNRVIILTDAYANTGEVDPSIISENIVINGMEGIYFSGLGIGADFNEAFLNELTDTGKGAYFSLVTKKDAKKAFQDRFIALLMVAAKEVRFSLDYPESMTHEITASEESSTIEDEVETTNFSYNTSQYFFEGFVADNNEVSLSDEFTLTISYKDPSSGEEIDEIISKSVEELVGQQENNIRDAETIYLFTRLLGNKTEWSDIKDIFNNYYQGYTSDIFEEYHKLMQVYASLTGTLKALIVGSWTASKPGMSCTEEYTFNSDGSFIINSADEVQTGTYEFGEIVQLGKRHSLTFNILTDNGLTSCSGDTEDDSGLSGIFYIEFGNNGQTFDVYIEPTGGDLLFSAVKND